MWWEGGRCVDGGRCGGKGGVEEREEWRDDSDNVEGGKCVDGGMFGGRELCGGRCVGREV